MLDIISVWKKKKRGLSEYMCQSPMNQGGGGGEGGWWHLVRKKGIEDVGRRLPGRFIEWIRPGIDPFFSLGVLTESSGVEAEVRWIDKGVRDGESADGDSKQLATRGGIMY